jgi:hypothetical protein
MPITWGVGGGGGGYAPVPVDPILGGQRPYIPPVDSGRPGQIIPEPIPLVPSVVYSSVARVVQAYQGNLISYNQAYDILVTQFGYSGLDATEALGVEMEETVAYQDLDTNAPGTPGYAGFDDTVSVPEISSTGGTVTAPMSRAPLFENFQFIGLVAVIGAVMLFKKQG